MFGSSCLVWAQVLLVIPRGQGADDVPLRILLRARLELPVDSLDHRVVVIALAALILDEANLGLSQRQRLAVPLAQVDACARRIVPQ